MYFMPLRYSHVPSNPHHINNIRPPETQLVYMYACWPIAIPGVGIEMTFRVSLPHCISSLYLTPGSKIRLQRSQEQELSVNISLHWPFSSTWEAAWKRRTEIVSVSGFLAFLNQVTAFSSGVFSLLDALTDVTRLSADLWPAQSIIEERYIIHSVCSIYILYTALYTYLVNQSTSKLLHFPSTIIVMYIH